MSDKTTITVQIPHECEQWLGTASRDRIMSLRSVGLSVANIARRFDVSREMIYRVMRSEPNEKAPAPDTSTGPTTNPEGSVTDGSAKPNVPETSKTKDTGGK